MPYAKPFLHSTVNIRNSITDRATCLTLGKPGISCIYFSSNIGPTTAIFEGKILLTLKQNATQ